jgi:diguanylate cyclase (GGDEF)-like protein/PAS domain S-box-containing protein
MHWNGFYTDMTKHNHLEEALKLKEWVFDHALDAIYLMDQENFLYANETACRSLGYSRDELLTLTLKDIDPQFAAGTEEKPCIVNKLLAEGAVTHETRHRRRDGSSFPVEIHASLLDYQGRQVVLSVVRDITERKRMEEAVLASEQEFRSLAESSPDFVIRYDREHRMRYLNSNLVHLLGLNGMDEVIGKRPGEVWPDGRFSVIDVAAARAIQCGSKQLVDLVVPVDNGEIVFNQIYVVPECNTAGEIVGTIAFGRDITGVMRMDQALKVSEEKHRTVFESANDGIFLHRIVERDGNTEFILHDLNQKGCELWGHSREDILTGNFDLLAMNNPPYSFEEATRRNLLAAAGEPQLFDWEIKRGDGSKVWGEVNLRRIQIGGESFLLAVMRDLNERKRMEEALAAREQEFRSLAENLPDNIARWDVETRYIYINSVCEHSLGTPAANVIGKPIHDAFPDGRFAPLATAVAHIVTTGETIMVVRQPVRLENGEMQFHDVKMAPERDVDGNIVSVLGIGRDMTEFYRLQDEVKAGEQQLRALAESLPGMMGAFYARADGSSCMPYVSPNIEKLFGLRPQDVADDASSLLARTHPEDALRISESIAVSARNMTTWHEEYRILHPALGERWIESNTNPQLHPDGGVIWYGYLHDITERKRLENEMIASEAQLRSRSDLLYAILESSPDMITFALDQSYRYIAFNSQHKDTMQAIWGRVIALGMNMLDVIGGHSDHHVAKKCFDRALAGECFTLEEAYGDETLTRQYWQNHYAPMYSAEGNVVGMTCFVTNISERKRIENVLKQSQEMLADAQKLALLGSWDWDVVRNRVEWSEMAYEIYTPDKRPDQPSFEDFKSSLHPDDFDLVCAAVQSAFDHDTSFDLDHRVVSASRGIRTVHAQAKVFRDVNGKPVRMVGTVQDITERKRMENLLKFLAQGEWLKSNEEFLSALADYLGRVLGLDYVIIDKLSADSAFAETVAIYARGAMIPNMQYSLQYTPCENVMNGGLCCYPEDVQQQFPGDTLLVDMQVESYAGIPLWDSKGKVIGLIAMMDGKPMSDTNLLTSMLQQVSTSAAAALERQQIELSLRESRDFLNKVIDGIADPIFVKDSEHRWLIANDALCGLIGQPREKLIGKSDYDFFSKEQSDIFWEKDQMVFASGKTNIIEEVITGANGVMQYIQTKKTPFVDADGQRLMVGVIRDITERKRLEDELRLAASVYEHSSEGMLITDADTRIVAINPAFTELTGYRIDEVAGKTPAMFKSGMQSKEFYQEMWLQLKNQGHWRGELWNRRKDGSIYAEYLNINAEINADGSVHRYVALFSDITDKKKKDELIWKHASFDSLTGLPNRRLFHDRLEQEVKMLLRSGSSMGLLFIDLDRFKEVNDTLGHAKGDALLIEASKRIRLCVRESDTVARLGGDEFTVIVPNYSEAIHLERIVQNILHELSVPFDLGEGVSCHISASIGIALFPDDTNKLEELLQFADQAMYEAKLAGRNQSSYFKSAMQANALEKMLLINDLRDSLARRELEVYYQPIVDSQTGKIDKAEALLRWKHPKRGFVSPAIFVPLAEESGLILEIGEWVFMQTINAIKHWENVSGKLIQVSVNKSPVQFVRAERNSWPEQLAASGLPKGCVVVEITEGLLLTDSVKVRNELLSFQERGIEVSIDDFGTGFSALSYLNQFDIDYLKIDISFVRTLVENERNRALTEAIIVMAHKLGIKTIAEGVETEAQRALLLQFGCDYIQGFLYFKPMPADEFMTLLRA